MDPQTYINSQVQGGADIVFAEMHNAMASTFSIMSRTIVENPSQVSAVSLELPLEVQELIDNAQAGNVEKDIFITQMRITMEQSYLHIALSMFNSDQITLDQYSGYVDFIESNIEGAIAGGNASYTLELLERDQEAFGALYDLTIFAADRNIPVYATDLDREVVILMDLGILTVEDWQARMDDASDFELLSQQVDLNAQGSILVHRGADHVLDLNGQASGLDDYLEAMGRKVTIIGNYLDIQTLSDSFKSAANIGFTYEESADLNIVDGRGYEKTVGELIQRGVNYGMQP